MVQDAEGNVKIQISDITDYVQQEGYIVFAHELLSFIII